MRRVLPLTLVALVLLGPAVPLADAQSGAAFFVNVVDAQSLGCSPDSFTSPDLRVRVLVNDQVVHETVKAQDQAKPLYADFVEVRADLPATIGVEVEEAEPKGLFGTTWVSCVMDDSGRTRHETRFGGEPALAVLARGSGERAAQAHVVVGTAPPARPIATADGLATDAATVSWDADTSGAATGHRLAWGDTGAVFGQFDKSASSTRLAELCDGTTYTMRVLRDAAPWHIESAPLVFTTPNAPPPAPRILESSTRDGNVTVRWEDGGVHDAERFEVHAGPDAGFTPTDDSLRAVRTTDFPAFRGWDAMFAPHAGDTHVLVKTVDHGGLETLSGVVKLETPSRPALDTQSTCMRQGGSPATPPPTDTRVPTPPSVTQEAEPGDALQTLQPDVERQSTADPAPPTPTDTLPAWVLLAMVASGGVLLGVIVMAVAKR